MSGPVARLGLSVPIVQAPMAGTSTPALAAAVSDAGGLGSIALGAGDAAAGRAAIAAVRAATSRPFGVNLFCHRPAVRDDARERGWIEALTPFFQRFDAKPPSALREIYRSFVEDDAMLAMLLAERPAVVSFHFGLPGDDRIVALKDGGAILFATATSVAEARAAVAAGVDVVVAQGFEAGGHRGVFDPDRPDERLPTATLTRLLVAAIDRPVIAAGGIMDGAGVAAALALGAEAAQLGTAFVACPESAADEAYRARLLGPEAGSTVMVDAISGRPARCLANGFTALAEGLRGVPRAAYPVAYDLGKALNAAAGSRGETGFGAQWAGQGAPLARVMPAADLVTALAQEMAAARQAAG